MSACQTVALLCHPTTTCPGVESIDVRISLTPDAGVSLAYRLWGRLDQLAIPSLLPSGSADGLWEHTCFEAFVAVAGSAAYREFNFSPSGQWAAYAFFGYRQREERAPPVPAPEISVRRFSDRLELDAVLGPALLPPAALGATPGATLQLGLCSVVEAADGSRSYWALAHPAARPDFHHRGAFTLNLAAHDTRT